MDVVDRLERLRQAEFRQDACRIGCVAVGEDQFAAGQASDQASEAGILGQHVQIDVMDVGEIMMRIDMMLAHQPGERGAVRLEIAFLDAPRLDEVVDPESLRDIGRHPDVDQTEQVGRRRIERVVEVEDPGADVGERGRHGRTA